MNSINAFLLTAAAVLVDYGVRTIQADLWAGAVILAFGFAAFLLYELTPPSVPPPTNP
jgi:hypothetical protein